MSYSKTVDFELGNNGDSVTTTNTASDLVRITAGAATGTISTTQAHAGTKSVHWVGTSTNGLGCVQYTLAGVTSTTVEGWLYVNSALPSAETCIARLLDSSNVVQAKLSINGVGAFVIRNAAGTSVFANTTGHRVTAGAWVRYLWDTTMGTSGTQRIRWYNATGTLIEDSTTLTSNNGANQLNFLYSGCKADTTTATSDLYLDDLAITGTTPATANAGADQANVEPWSTVTLDGTASASATSYAWTQTAGTTVTLSSSTAVQPTFTAPPTIAGDTLTFSLVVNGTSSPDTVDIVVLPATERAAIGGVEVPARLLAVSST